MGSYINIEERKVKLKMLADYIINNVTASRENILSYASSIGLGKTYDYLMRLCNQYLDNDTLLKLEHVFIEKLKVVADYIIDKKPTMEETVIYAKTIGIIDINKTYQSLMKLFHEYLDKEVLKYIEEVNKSWMEDIANFIIKNNANKFETMNYAKSIGINFSYKILKKMLYQYLDDEAIKNIEKIKEANISAKLHDHLFDNKNKYIYAKAVLSNLPYNTLKEIFLMALTYRLSFHNICVMFKCPFDDLELAINKCQELRTAMYFLDISTKNESEEFSQLALKNVQEYWSKRQKLIKDKNNAQTKEHKEYINELLKKHRSLIDDSYIEVIKNKKDQELTEMEWEIVARFKVKYWLTERNIATSVNKSTEIVRRYCNKLALEDPIYKEQLDLLNSYNYNNFMNDLGYKK